MTEPARYPGNDPGAHHTAQPDAAPAGGPGWARPDVASAPVPPGYSQPGPHWGAPPPVRASHPGSPWGAGPSGPPQGGGWGPPPPREAVLRPKRVDPVAGTPFGVVQFDVPPVTSGLAVGALVAGVVSTLVALVVFCVAGVAGADGAWAAGAFTMLGALTGAGATVAGLLGLRQIRRPAGPQAVRFTGRGLAMFGIGGGGAGLLLSMLGLGLVLVLGLS